MASTTTKAFSCRWGTMDFPIYTLKDGKVQPTKRQQFEYFPAVCLSIPRALAMAYAVSPLAARLAMFWRTSIPSLGRPILMPLALARFIPAFVRSLIFCASTFANDESRASRMFLTSSLSVARCGSV